MRRNLLLPLGLLTCGLLIGFQAPPPPKPAPSGPPQPVNILISADVNDYVNSGMSTERIQKALAVLEKYHQADPHLSATFYFSGAMSDALEKENEQNHLLNALRSAGKNGLVKFAYDGNDEPTYSARPKLEMEKAKNAEERWLIRTALVKQLLKEAHDPMTGAVIPGKTGGLNRMQEVFGPPAIIRGVVLQIPNLWGTINEVGGEPEIVNILRSEHDAGILQGLPDSDLARTASSQFRPWANVFTRDMSPTADTSPEVWWQDTALRLSETSRLDIRVFRASDGVDKLKALLQGLDRSRPRVIHVELSSVRSYLKPPTPIMPRPVQPLGWAWEHPDKPALPEDLCYPAAEMATRYQQQDEAIAYLVQQFLPANAGSRVVNPSDIEAAAAKGWGYDVSTADLIASVNTTLSEWGDRPTPPLFVKVGDRYASLADWFDLLANALAEKNHKGKLPAHVHQDRVFGPVLTTPPKPPAEGEVTAEAVSRVSAKLVEALRDDSWAERPRNMIPSPVEIEGMKLGPSQFLRLMAEALVAPSEQSKLQIKPEQMFAGPVVLFYHRRLTSDLGSPWTIKPASLNLSAISK